ncbi:hypothetical protein AT15_06805 [Kosmotoga arenicorallina S304]|uniref:HAD family hydrolase n=1 Tax=Kosmotoga arenicorallina S304 TaxID=1453497 RepID=A0A176K1W9_9BACT|nr:HAD hydrolase-like protein [Kosmotoga arenicorallina]OAA31200.1 hypothetical protein AT15_06805 [Kosmotoga arenicorallina S304]
MVFCYLFDLDGTLTENSDEEFIQTYFGLISKYVGDSMQTEKIKRAIFSSLKALVGKDDRRNNFDFFMDNFAKEIGSRNPDHWANFFMNFYNTTYNELRSFVKPRKRIIEVVEKLKKQGHKIVLATNPIFPAVAIEKRIRWIGLNPEVFDYITSMENSFSVKPSIEYYRYILEMIGFPPERSIMVGNDAVLDGICAKAGIQFVDISSIEKIICDKSN